MVTNLSPLILSTTGECVYISPYFTRVIYICINLFICIQFFRREYQTLSPGSSAAGRLSNCDESVSRGRETGTKGREIGTKGRRTGTIGTKERGNEKPYGLVQIDYWDRGTSPRHVWTWRGRVTPFLDV